MSDDFKRNENIMPMKDINKLTATALAEVAHWFRSFSEGIEIPKNTYTNLGGMSWDCRIGLQPTQEEVHSVRLYCLDNQVDVMYQVWRLSIEVGCTLFCSSDLQADHPCDIDLSIPKKYNEFLAARFLPNRLTCETSNE